jgi:hypothetical protein
MRNLQKLAPALSGAALLVLVGCANDRVLSTRHLQTIDADPHHSEKAYVEFSVIPKREKGVVPIYLIDDPQHPRLLAATGLLEGDHYSFTRHATQVGERVRIALAPGVHTFTVEREGPLVRVNLQEGKVTPVVIDYVLVHQGASYVVYRAACQTFDPVPFEEASRPRG